MKRMCLAVCCALQVSLPTPLHAQAQAQAPAQAPASTATAPAAAATPGSAVAQARRQRLALVIGNGMLGTRQVLDSARRDSEAVAAALRAGGFDVLLRLDLGGAELRAAIQEFRGRVPADGVGLIFYTGMAAQVDGRNLLLPADLTLHEAQAAPAVAAMLRAAGVPLQEAVDALAGGAESPRLLLVDAAYRHPALGRLTPPGLARPRLASGTMVLLGHAPSVLQDPPSVSALPAPSNVKPDPKELAASRFARVVVEAFTTPRISVPEALRAIRLSVQDSSGGLTQPWIAGDTYAREYLADAAALEAPGAAAAAPPAVAAAAAATAAAAAPPDAPRRDTDGRTAQAPGQGERPVFQARSNSHGHAEGDILTYQVSDTRKDEVLRSYTLAIDQVRADGDLVANGGQVLLDPQGRLLSQRDGGGDGPQSLFEPAQELWWARAQAGESRPVAFRETYVRADKKRGHIDWRGTAQVGSQRVLETQAGEFDVLPIRTTGQATDTPSGGKPVALQFTRTVWYSPKLGMPVAVDIEDSDAAGRALRRERVELTHAQQARTAN